MDGDGDLDLLTARASGAVNPVDLNSSDLIWLENPGNPVFSPGTSNNGAGQWKTYVITSAHNIADTYLDAFQNPAGPAGNIIVIAGGFASQTLAIFQSKNWKNVDSVSANIIDNDGNYFTQQFADLDQDGILDVIITIGSYSVQNGKLIVYRGSFNDDSEYNLSQKSVIYDQFPVWPSPGLGSPGEGTAFWYSDLAKQSYRPPNILVSGDDDGNIYIAEPASSIFGDYNLKTIYTSAEFNPKQNPLNAPTVGKPVTGDFTGNGCNDIVVPNYRNEQLVVLELEEGFCGTN